MALKELNVPVDLSFTRARTTVYRPRHQMDRVRRYVKFLWKYLKAPWFLSRGAMRREFSSVSTMLGSICGLIWGVLSAASMIPLEFG